MAGEPPEWAQCDHDGCIGVQSCTSLCLAHATEHAPHAFDAELKRIGAEGTVDARAVVIVPELLRRLLAAAPREDGRPALSAARFDRAIFQGRADFEGVSFQGRANFGGASFQGKANFGGASFDDWALFGGVIFEDEAWFGAAKFSGGAGFDRAEFHSKAGFHSATFYAPVFKGARFHGRALFDLAEIRSIAHFEETSFQGDARFQGASFHGEARFEGARFQGRVEFYGARFQGKAGFDHASLERATQVGPLLARQLVLDGAVFGARVQLDVTAVEVSALQTQFPAGVHLRLRYAMVDLDDANLAAPAILAGAPTPFYPFRDREEQIVRGLEPLPPEPIEQRWRPRLLSVRDADVAGLHLADVDLRACQFAGAHNLDRLRIEGPPFFVSTPGWWRTRRKTLAEEQLWRAMRPGRGRRGRWRGAGWYPLVCQLPASRGGALGEYPAALQPAQLAALYRDLRKGREDAKDEPGAADFYYGECEMRRHNPSAPRAERLVLWGYWLLSGYALRAWRALAALAVVVVLAGIVLAFWGFPNSAPSFRPAAVDSGGALVYEQQPIDPPAGLQRLPDAVRFSARSATALLRGPDRPLTPLGEWVEIGLRFAGPVLLGLAVLSVRGRVRR